MRQFLEELFTTGQLTVPGAGADFDDEPHDDEILRFDSVARLNMPNEAPGLDMQTARWAARMLAKSVRLLIVRSCSEEQIDAVFSDPCPRDRSSLSPEVDYSADLFLRHFPALVALARRLAPGDPLVDRIRSFMEAWPLSSVGMEGMPPSPVDSFIGHPGMRQLYADRILSGEEAARVTHPLLAETILVSIGAHEELNPGIAKAAQEIAASGAK